MTSQVRIVIDGSFYRAASSYFRFGDPRKKWINPEAFRDLLVEETAHFLEVPNPSHLGVSAYYYDGENPSSQDDSFEKNLFKRIKSAGIHPCLTPLVKRGPEGREKFVQRGVMERLIVDTLSSAYKNEYDILVLVTGTKDLVPLVNAVRSTSKMVLVAYWDIPRWFDGSHSRNPTRPSTELLNSANDEMNLSEIVNSDPLEGGTNWSEELFS